MDVAVEATPPRCENCPADLTPDEQRARLDDIFAKLSVLETD